jgi:hypothetical protein
MKFDPESCIVVPAVRSEAAPEKIDNSVEEERLC